MTTVYLKIINLGLFCIPTRLNDIKKQPVHNAMALVSSPKSLMKSPKINPKQGIAPSVSVYFQNNYFNFIP